MLYLPEAHTDFVSAIIGEELGFLGILALCAAYLVIVSRGVKIALEAADDYGSFLAFGIATMFGVQALTNLAVAMAIFPTKGLTLPFLSYGGSSLLVNAIAVGILLSISRPRTALPDRAEARVAGHRAERVRAGRDGGRRGRGPARRDGIVVTVLIAGGGTGGHVYPMLAVGDAVRAVGCRRRASSTWARRAASRARAIGDRGGEELFLLDVAPLRGAGVIGFVKGVARAAGSLPEARALVRRLRPDVALSAGGYAGGPIALAARLHGVPVALLEPNSVLGLSNRLLTPFAERAYVAFPEAERYLRPSTVRRLGVPLRRAFVARAATSPRRGPISVLVLGGSQGAKGINEARAARRRRRRERRRRRRRSRTRPAAIATPRCAPRTPRSGSRRGPRGALHRRRGRGARRAPTLVIERAGASSLAELCAVGRASNPHPLPLRRRRSPAEERPLAGARRRRRRHRRGGGDARAPRRRDRRARRAIPRAAPAWRAPPRARPARRGARGGARSARSRPVTARGRVKEAC